MVTILGFHKLGPVVLAVTIIGSCESTMICVVCLRVISFSDHRLFKTRFMEAMVVIKTADLVALKEVLVANLAMVLALQILLGSANLEVRH